MSPATRRAPAPPPGPGHRRRRAAALSAALAALALGLTGRLTAHPAAAAETHADHRFAGASFHAGPDPTTTTPRPPTTGSGPPSGSRTPVPPRPST
ncbi:hypothetical protein ACGFZB_38825 [Streptomyces cinerochromogenes]|uniref:Uncharacterized protein n=1 Tax=Streptomyces cinerochromogenes TaxID=66422 RepID=A0ABW7BKL3_9ACTN